MLDSPVLIIDSKLTLCFYKIRHEQFKNKSTRGTYRTLYLSKGDRQCLQYTWDFLLHESRSQARLPI